MDLGLANRTAIVCGASSGIGLAIAEALALEGANETHVAGMACLLREGARPFEELHVLVNLAEER